MKNPSKSQVGLKKLPKDVRNKMGYFANGGNVHKMPDDSMMSDNDPSMGSYEHGGQVSNSGKSRGGGAALSGTKFTGVK
jgi:hypothetical protein